MNEEFIADLICEAYGNESIKYKFHNKKDLFHFSWRLQESDYLSEIEIIYDGTIYFTKNFIKNMTADIDQMVQAARSGKQNIVEVAWHF